jgi:hypothetical protein
LLKVPQGVNEFLGQAMIRRQPPQQKCQQQGNQGDNNQILQITFSAVSSE